MKKIVNICIILGLLNKSYQRRFNDVHPTEATKKNAEPSFLDHGDFEPTYGYIEDEDNKGNWNYEWLNRVSILENFQ